MSGAPPLAPGDPWEAEGRRACAAVAGAAAVVVSGRDPALAARVAVGLARAASESRRVALGDLVGDLSPIYALAGGEDAPGLADCFRDGLTLNDVARPVPSVEGLFVLPAGTPPSGTPVLLAHERWRRLVRGFASANGLLVLVADAGTPGLEALADAGAALVSVGQPAGALRRFRLLAVADVAPPPAAPRPERPRRARRPLRDRVWFAVAVVGAVIAGGAVGVAWVWLRHPANGSYALARRQLPLGEASVAAATPAGGRSIERVDTIRLAESIRASDSADVAPWAVEVVAASSAAMANSLLQDGARATPLPAATISPVVLRGAATGGTLWHKVVVGAWRSRAGADSLLATMRRLGLTRPDAGTVVRVPFALVIGDGVSRERAAAMVSVWRARGFGAYALEQHDGAVRVYVGAFETPTQCAALASLVRDAGLTPVVAYRTGRPF